MGILDPEADHYSLRPMRYPLFFNRYKQARKNIWSVEEASFVTDKHDLLHKLTESEKHVISRIVAFFATGDSLVLDNLVNSLIKHVRSPELGMYYAQQSAEEALHIEAYLTLLENYIPDPDEQVKAFRALHDIPSIARKGEFCIKWMDSIKKIDVLDTDDKKKQFLLNVITFACAIEGLFFYGAFSYVYFMRTVRQVLNGLGDITNWVFRDESMHMEVAFDLIDVIKSEYPHLWDDDLKNNIKEMLAEAIDCEMQFAKDTLSLGVAGLSIQDMQTYLECVADERYVRLGMEPVYGSKNPFSFMMFQNLRPVTNFFERSVTEYSTGFIADTSTINISSDF